MTLKELYKLVIEKKSVENKLNELSFQQTDLENKIDELKKIMKKEQKDVDKLEMISLSSILSDLFGNKEEKLNKERKEAYEAKIKYDSCKIQIQSVKLDIKYYQDKLDKLSNCEEEYKQLLQEKKELLKDKLEVIELDNKISDSLHFQNEINEAIEECRKALLICDKVMSHLNDANDFAAFDIVIKGGYLMHALKYDMIDKAQEEVNHLQVQLNKLKTELVDVQINQEINISINDFDRNVDLWVDNIFTDYSVKEKIIQSINQIKNTMDIVREIQMKLENLLELEKDKMNKLNKGLEVILVNS